MGLTDRAGARAIAPVAQVATAVAFFAAASACGGASLMGPGAAAQSSGSAPSVAPGWTNAAHREQATKEFALLRNKYRPSPATFRVTVRFASSAGLGSVITRGAMARRPPDDLRVILLGPGGVTAFDLLSRHAYWRLRIPSKNQHLEGRTEADAAKHEGLPVAFLRWWLLRPLEGELIGARSDAQGTVFVVRQRSGDGAALGEPAHVLVQQRREGLVLERRAGNAVERMRIDGPGCRDALYEQASSNLRVTVHCEQQVAASVRDEMFR